MIFPMIAKPHPAHLRPPPRAGGKGRELDLGGEDEGEEGRVILGIDEDEPESRLIPGTSKITGLFFFGFSSSSTVIRIWGPVPSSSVSWSS